MSRHKLRDLGIDLPLFPTTSVGSFPKPAYVTKARAEFTAGEISGAAMEAAERRATEFWIREQEALGVDVLVDGEMYRGDMVAYFAEHFQGFERGGLVRSYGNRYYHKPVITGEVGWTEPITLRWWRFAQDLTRKPVKAMLTGPYTMMDWCFDEYYPSRRAACLALAREIRKEVEALAAAGAKIIQVDEPAVSVRPDELPLALEAMDVVTRGVRAYFVTHICYGDFERIYPRMLDLAVDNFDLEMSNSRLDMLELFRAHPFTKDLSLGVADVHTHLPESSESVRNRLQRALDVLPTDALWVDPDCGLKTRTTDEALAKMRAVVEGAEAVRAAVVSPA